MRGRFDSALAVWLLYKSLVSSGQSAVFLPIFLSDELLLTRVHDALTVFCFFSRSTTSDFPPIMQRSAVLLALSAALPHVAAHGYLSQVVIDGVAYAGNEPNNYQGACLGRWQIAPVY